MNLMLTEDQAAVLLDQGSRAVVEVEQARRAGAVFEGLPGEATVRGARSSSPAVPLFLPLTSSPQPLCRPAPYPPAAQMTGCRARLEMADGPRGTFGRLALAGPAEAVAYAQWLLGQRLSAAASYQMGGTTYYRRGPL